MSFLAAILSRRKLPDGYDQACKFKARTRSVEKLDLGKGRTLTFSWGSDVYGRMGGGQHVGPKQKTLPDICLQCKAAEKVPARASPREVKCLRGADIANVVCGPAHTYVVTETGRLLFFGKCHEGQAGVGLRKGPSLDSCVDFPIEVPLHRISIDKIATSVEHVLITSGDQMWSWGSGSFGKLGHGDEKPCYVPKKVEAFAGERIVSLGACRSYSVVAVASKRTLDDDGDGDTSIIRIHTFGLDPTRKTAIIRNPERHVSYTMKGTRVDVSCGYSHHFLVTPDGRALGFGPNMYGELGEIDGKEPRLLCGRRLRKIAAGDGWSAALLDNGTVLTAGKNNYGQLGSGDWSNRNKFLPILFTDDTALLNGGVSHVAAGREHLVLVCSDRKKTRPALFMTGQNYRGQLGVGYAGTRLAIARPVVGLAFKDGSSVRFVIAGTNHTLVVVNTAADTKAQCLGGHTDGDERDVLLAPFCESSKEGAA